jgi:uncharacterized protein (TIGR03435 family)
MGVLSFVAMPVPAAIAQAAAAKANIDDTWQGTLHTERDLRIVLKITKAADGTLKSAFYSIDQGGQPIPVKTTTFAAGELKVGVEVIDGTFVGKMSPDGNTITGEWTQGGKPLPLILLRANPETAWTIPEPPPKMAPMAADADPSFDVATIKLSDPASRGKGFGGPPGHFQTRNTTLNDLMMYAYRVHTKQLVGGPDWMDTEKFDIVTKPDTPGAASDKQNQLMMRKLLVSRFGLKFHEEKRDLSAFILTIAKGGPKLTKSESDADALSGFGFRALGNLTFRNITMPDFASWMQTVLDRPVVDHTELQGRFDGKLLWNPDETQFAVFGPPPTPSTAPDAPPDLYKAIQEQIGLKLDAAKTPVTVIVLDHVEKPSEN